ncbi:FAD-binding domain-containing protein [Henriciella barbarensis]|nr:FAD-binding domain-containing protein [Henriciella barbarensis]
MGAQYAHRRNIDPGEDARPNVSQLSPFLRHRLISEEEAATAAIIVNGGEQATKYIQEICWRTYFKGWLEHHPAVWSDYILDRDTQFQTLEKDKGLRADYEAAIEGRAGIEGFDHWAKELAETGYLHNHARMSFASIWLFTLKLPWALGADFFLRHLLDGDPASNTLSWRWVAGLHTSGKTYLAKKEAIETCSDGRFSPDNLAQSAHQVPGSENPQPQQLPVSDGMPEERFALLLTEDDLSVETWLDEHLPVEAIAGLESAGGRCTGDVSDKAMSFTRGALQDGLSRASNHFGAAAENLSDTADKRRALRDWAAQLNTKHIVVPYLPAGWTREAIAPLLTDLQTDGFHIHQMRRDWDERFWPHAKKGFFKLRKQIPSVLMHWKLRKV